MSKKDNITPAQLIKSLKSEVLSNTKTNNYIPDIITFCEDNRYLGLSLNSSGGLHPVQRIALKIFYRGSAGNENLELTEEEIEICKKSGLDSEMNGDVLNKWNNGEIFRELVLVWGRRSGKDFLSSIIATYETMRLIEVTQGDPENYYKIKTASGISILTVAASKEQAQIAFGQIRDKILSSPYFNEKIGPEGLQMGAIYIVTEKDRIKNEELKKQGRPEQKGSIVVEVGHSNSDTLRGKDIFVCIMDEVAFYKNSGGSSSGDQIYSAVGPAVKTFNRKLPLKDKHGNQVLDDFGKPKYKIHFDGKLILISSPASKEGIFWNAYSSANKPESSHVLMMKSPTWVVNPNFTEESLRAEFSSYSEEQFQMEFGAEFAGEAGESFLPKDDVLACFDPTLTIRERGTPGIAYFAHLDPAVSSNNYALAIVHKENYLAEDGTLSFRIIVDHIKHWSPSPNQPIKNEEVESYILSLKHRFYFSLITYDQWKSLASIDKLKNMGVPSKMTTFSRKYQMDIYGELRNLIIEKRIKFPEYQLLKAELLALQRRFTENNTFKIFPKPDGTCKTDDVADAVAGATFSCINHSMKKLATSKLANVPLNSSSNTRLWQGMSGPIGYGTGQQINNWRNNIASWPDKK